MNVLESKGLESAEVQFAGFFLFPSLIIACGRMAQGRSRVTKSQEAEKWVNESPAMSRSLM
jgi:hypothetical protein